VQSIPGLYIDGKFTPVNYIMGREFVGESVRICEQAIRRDCGFGEYTK
jgi:hypothetical protein